MLLLSHIYKNICLSDACMMTDAGPAAGHTDSGVHHSNIRAAAEPVLCASDIWPVAGIWNDVSDLVSTSHIAREASTAHRSTPYTLQSLGLTCEEIAL